MTIHKSKSMFESKFLLIALVIASIAAGSLGYSLINHHAPATTAAQAIAVPSFHPKADDASSSSATDASHDGTAKPLVHPMAQNAPGIIIDTPAGSVIENSTKVTGKAGLASGQLGYRIKGDSSGKIAGGIIRVSTNAANPQAFSFPASFEHAPSTGDVGTVELYDVQHDKTVATIQVRLK